MYALVRAVGVRALLTQQLPLIVASLLVMEGIVEFVGEMGAPRAIPWRRTTHPPTVP